MESFVSPGNLDPASFTQTRSSWKTTPLKYAFCLHEARLSGCLVITASSVVGDRGGCVHVLRLSAVCTRNNNWRHVHAIQSIDAIRRAQHYGTRRSRHAIPHHIMLICPSHRFHYCAYACMLLSYLGRWLRGWLLDRKNHVTGLQQQQAWQGPGHHRLWRRRGWGPACIHSQLAGTCAEEWAYAHTRHLAWVWTARRLYVITSARACGCVCPWNGMSANVVFVDETSKSCPFPMR